MSNTEISENQDVIKDPNLSSTDYLVDQITKLNNLIDSGLIKNLSMLDELRELSKLSSLDNLEKLNNLQSLSQLTQLESLSKLTKLDNLKDLTNLEYLSSLDKLDLLKNLELVNRHFESNVSKLKELDNLKSLDRLDSLSKLEKLEILSKLDNLTSLNKLDELKSLNKLDDLTELKKLENLKELDRLDSFLQILKEKGNDLQNLQKLDLLNNLEKLDHLESLNQLRGLDNLKDLQYLDRLENLSNLDKIDGLKELGELSKLDHLSKLESLNKLENLASLEYLSKINKLETMSTDGTLNQLNKLDKIDILNTQKKKIVFTAFLSSFLDFIKIGAIVVLLLFVILKTNREDSRLSLLQNIAMNESDALAITFPLLRNSLTVKNFSNLFEKTLTIYKNKIDRYWIPRNLTGEKLDIMHTIWNINFKDGSYDLTSEVQSHWNYLRDDAKTYLDSEAKKINKNTTENEKEMVDLRRLKNLVFSKRCEESFKLSKSFRPNHEWKTYIITSQLLSLDCLRGIDKLPKDL
ncbi:hypothetical protein [Halobacteriovorax sp. JY17]|uniref:hypothetical protein n=1 Tax=Halobacteriovorax sp. JY17 TaxID=2014617 RepID=UPI000C50C539|nr:hypothetical protein [Halobacteriovorax sp. JY17]PIK14818.1 MAG: hypothetical protein CES88_10810 [Halobacteriovorax sp. JY17]